jgi:hypothetical protein
MLTPKDHNLTHLARRRNKFLERNDTGNFKGLTTMIQRGGKLNTALKFGVEG